MNSLEDGFIDFVAVGIQIPESLVPSVEALEQLIGQEKPPDNSVDLVKWNMLALAHLKYLAAEALKDVRHNYINESSSDDFRIV